MKYLFFSLLFVLLIPCGVLGADRTVTINWMQTGTAEIEGFSMYYSYDSSMLDKFLACETDEITVRTLTCENVKLEQSPVYFVIATQILTGDISSPVASKGFTFLLSKVQEFRF